jgi:hypothetical protein
MALSGSPQKDGIPAATCIDAPGNTWAPLSRAHMSPPPTLTLEIPKSASLALPPTSRTFWGFRSRWTTPVKQIVKHCSVPRQRSVHMASHKYRRQQRGNFVQEEEQQLDRGKEQLTSELWQMSTSLDRCNALRSNYLPAACRTLSPAAMSMAICAQC